jgi:hypothetical protein
VGTVRAAVRACTLVAAVLAGLLAARPARADVQVECDFGHGGGWVADAPTPVWITLKNTAADAVHVQLTIRVLGGGDAYVVEREVPLGPQATRREPFLVPGPTTRIPNVVVRVETSPTVPIHMAGTTADRGNLETTVVGIANAALGVHHDGRRAMGVLFDPRSVLASRLTSVDLRLTTSKVPGFAPRSVAHLLPVDAEALALAPLALNGFETLVVCDPDATFCADPAHLDALLDWTALGGRLVVSLGENAAAFAASPLAEHLPARWAAGREDYSAYIDLLCDRDLPVTLREGPVARLAPAPGATQGRIAPLVERAFGAGTIVVAGLDLRLLVETAPKDDDVLRAVGAPFLLARRAGEDPWDDATILDSEFDVAGRLGATLQAEAFRPPPLLAVLIGLIVYVAVVGPLDWLVLKRLRKERYTTFTFGGAVVVFTVLAYGVSLFLFSADAVANRVTFVQLAASGRPARELARVHDLVGWYAPTGGTREMTLPLPGAVLGSNLPGLQSAGRLGADLPLVVRGNDPLAPKAAVEVGFRSQRVVHSECVGTTGQTLEARRTGGADDEVEVASTLPVDLADCWVFLPHGKAIHVGAVGAGATVRASGPRPVRSLGIAGDVTDASLHDVRAARREAAAVSAREFLAHVVAAAMVSATPPTGWRSLRRAGIVREPPRDGRALVVGVASEPPFPLAGSGLRGAQHVVISKEVELR